MRSQVRNLAIILILAVVMIGLGRLVGGWTAPEGPISENEVLRLIKNLDRPMGNRIDGDSTRAVAGLLVPVTAQAHWPTVIEELTLAKKYGVGSYILAVDLPWNDEEWDVLPRLSEAVTLLDGAEIWLALDLNPTLSWLEDNPDEASTFATEGMLFPSIGSTQWRDDGAEAMIRAATELAQAHPDVRVAGVILRGLEEGNWYRTVGFDRSAANTTAFQNALEARYGDPATLSEAWDAGYESFALVECPEPPIEQRTTFFSGPDAPLYVDYMAYLSHATADTIGFFVERARDAFGATTQVYASYGSSFDLSWPEYGQWALGTLLEGPVDGLALGVVRQDRTLGGIGGTSGPATVPGTKGKRWMLIDDTRTGIGWNDSTNAVFKPAGFEARTLAPIYDRNLAMAAMEQGGVYWADARGQGNFLDDSVWDHFASRVPVLDELQHAEISSARTLVVVLDEASMYHVADGARVSDSLLNASRHAVQQAGTSFGYVLFQDLLVGRAPEARVFLFPNLFNVSEADREALHAYFAEHGAAAIWLYAPGSLADEDAAEAVSKTTGITVESYTEPGDPVSKFALAGNWLPENEPIGQSAPWFPLFYINDEAADPLARYVQTEDPSIAVKFMEEGWASVFVAVPTLTPALLKEILDILDHPPVMRPTGPHRKQSIAMRGDYMLVHSTDAGDRIFDFTGRHDIVDMFSKDSAWPDKRMLQISLRAGESRLFKLLPSQAAADAGDYADVVQESPEIAPESPAISTETNTGEMDPAAVDPAESPAGEVLEQP